MARRRRHGDLKVGINARLPPYEEGPDTDSDAPPDAAPHADAAHEQYTDERTANRGIRALARLCAQRRPWLLALGLVRPHLPFNAPARFWRAAREAGARGAVGAEAHAPDGLSPLTAAHLGAGDGELCAVVAFEPMAAAGQRRRASVPTCRFTHPASADDFRGPRHVEAASTQGRTLSTAYAAAVAFADYHVGRVLAALERLGGLNHTVTVLLSDHGWKLGHHGAWGKHTLTAHDTHVPLMIRAPGFAPKRVHAPAELIDVYPTLLELTSVPRPPAATEASVSSSDEAKEGRGRSTAPPLEGRSLVPLMRRPSPRAAVARSVALSQWPLRAHGARCMGYAIRTQGWVLIEWTDDPREARPVVVASGRGACDGPSDLFRVDRNASRRGVLREALVRGGTRREAVMRRTLRRRLRRMLRRSAANLNEGAP